MAIDWITVSAQIINFLILVWLLKRFLYKPVIRAMNKRKQTIAERLNQAREREREAKQKIQLYQVKAGKLKNARDRILDDAKLEAAKQKKQLLELARAELHEKLDLWQRQVVEEKQEFMTSLRARASENIQAIARKALHDLADAELENQVVNTFIKQLKTVDKKTRKSLSEASEPLTIASAFELSASLRDRLSNAINEHLCPGIEVNYTESPELLCGIELSRGGHRLSWNLVNYLDELNNNIEQAFSSIAPAREEA